MLSKFKLPLISGNTSIKKTSYFGFGGDETEPGSIMFSTINAYETIEVGSVDIQSGKLEEAHKKMGELIDKVPEEYRTTAYIYSGSSSYTIYYTRQKTFEEMSNELDVAEQNTIQTFTRQHNELRRGIANLASDRLRLEQMKNGDLL